MSVTGTLSRFKQPEYTGENRCLPCTLVNTLIAFVLAAGIFLLGTTQVSTVAAAGGAVGFFLLCLLSIYVRGYLVPGTPELTKRYFPASVLALFGKGPAQATSPDGEVDPERALMQAGALEECADSDDLCLTDSFRRVWYAEIDRADREDTGRDRLLELLGVDDGDLTFEEFGDAFRARVDGRVVGKWESEAAFLADVAGATILEERYPSWNALSLEDKSQLLNGLRLFIDTCPACEGTPEFETETVESCCSTHQVAAVACTDCDARLFESRA